MADGRALVAAVRDRNPDVILLDISMPVLNGLEAARQILTATRAGRPRLRVTNTGLLVPGDQIDRLLQPFQRLDDQRSTDRDGLGLGLSIVAAIAAAHGASVSLHPQPTGGMTVDVVFPHSLTTPGSPPDPPGVAAQRPDLARETTAPVPVSP